MTKGILFMNFGTKHNAHFAVAFHSARKHWSGPIAILTDESNRANMNHIAEHDPVQKTQVIVFKLYTRQSHGPGAGYLNKTRLIDLMPFLHSVFLDSDTCTVGAIDPMFPADVEIRLTAFSDWKTTGKTMTKRISRWRNVMPQEVALQTAIDYPALNTGVMGLSKLAKKLSKRWQTVTAKNVSFMCDELAMQLIFLEGPHVVFPDYFNCSPVYSPRRQGFDESKVRIWHGHGMKSVRHPKGLSIWLPELLELWQDDLYGVRRSFTENRYFRRLSSNAVEFIRQYGRDDAESLITRNRITEGSFRP